VYEVDNAAGRLAVVDAHGDQPSVARASGA
jgi:hypothetical protein